MAQSCTFEYEMKSERTAQKGSVINHLCCGGGLHSGCFGGSSVALEWKLLGLGRESYDLNITCSLPHPTSRSLFTPPLHTST